VGGRVAPILAYMRGWSEESILNYCRRKGWHGETMSDEYKKYDSEIRVEYIGARLTKDAEVRDGANGKMVRLTVVATSKAESDSDLWLEVNVQDSQAELAAHLKKGDTLHKIEGFLTLRKYGENNEKFSINVRRARLSVPIGPVVTIGDLKERGFVPGAGGQAAKKGGKTPPAKKPPAKKIVDLDDEE